MLLRLCSRFVVASAIFRLLQIILRYAFPTIRFHRALVNRMPHLFEIAYPTCQSEASEPFERIESRDRSPCLKVG